MKRLIKAKPCRNTMPGKWLGRWPKEPMRRWTIIINCFLLFITLLQKLLLKRWDIGRWIYIVCLMVSALSVSLWEYSFRRLFVEFADNCEMITSILRSGYYTYIITSVIIISFLLLLDISKKHYSDI